MIVVVVVAAFMMGKTGGEVGVHCVDRGWVEDRQTVL
jgi:hypothetical protein